MSTTLRFDDLLAARLVAKQQPQHRAYLLQALAALGQGAGQRSLLYGLVADGLLTMDDARGVQEMVERYKRGRGMGIYGQLVAPHGVTEDRLRELARRLGPQADMNALGDALVRAGALAAAQEQQVRFQARVALDRDLARQVQEHLAAAAPGAAVGAETPRVTNRFEAAIPQVPSGVFRLESPLPPLPEARAIVASALTSSDEGLTGPRFAIPGWVDTSDPSVGKLKIGPYQVVGKIGAGGMGVVYLAQGEDEPTRPVAVKVLRKGAPAETVGRFKREMLANSLFHHPNVLEIFDAGQTDKGEHFLAMEFFDGRSLAHVLEDERRLPARAGLRLVCQVAEALGTAHEAGIVHRDLKPENILVSHDRQQAKLMDFGISLVRDLGEFQDRVFRTVGSNIVGTPKYMSPEQASGDELSPASDLYSLGLVLYELLTGKFPFESDGPLGYISCHMIEDPRPMAAVEPFTEFLPAELQALVPRLLEKDPETRPQRAAEVVAVIEAALPRVMDD